MKIRTLTLLLFASGMSASASAGACPNSFLADIAATTGLIIDCETARKLDSIHCNPVSSPAAIVAIDTTPYLAEGRPASAEAEKLSTLIVDFEVDTSAKGDRTTRGDRRLQPLGARRRWPAEPREPEGERSPHPWRDGGCPNHRSLPGL